MAIKSQILISDTNVKLIELISTIYNVMLLAFYRAIDQSKTIFNLVNGFMDEYEDESGIDTVNSTGEEYNSTDDYYTNTTSLDAYTKLLLHGDGDNGSQTFTDECGKTITPVGTAQISTSQKKFGTGSGLFNGTSGYLSVPDSDDFYFGTGDFTVDTWLRFTQSAAAHYIFLQGDYNGGSYLAFYINAGKLILEWKNTTANQAYCAFTPSLDTWYHVAVVKSSGTWYMFIDGISKTIGSYANPSDALPNVSASINIGAAYSIHGGLVGYMDELRVSKGIARWTSNFTPSTLPYGSAENFVLISNSVTADTTPSSARIVLFEEDVDAITLNTDLKAYVSRDGGTTYTQVTLENEGYYAVSKNILAGLADISGQPSGTSMKYKIETLNNKTLKLHGAGVNWA
jgi:hypothetical protein